MSSTKRPGRVIQERDRHILRELDVMRVMDRELAEVVGGFHSASRANRRLRALTDIGLLRRSFLGTSAAGRKAVYRLSPEGALVADVPYRGLRRRADEISAKDYFIEHQLTVNRIYAALKYSTIPVPGVEFVRWAAFYGPLADNLPLIPDGYFVLKTPGGLIGHFVEVDMGTETRAVWKGKVENYLKLALSDECEQLIDVRRFRVIVLAHSLRRLDSIRAVVAAIVDKIFWFASLADIAGGGFFDPVWFRPVGDAQVSLLGQPQ